MISRRGFIGGVLAAIVAPRIKPAKPVYTLTRNLHATAVTVDPGVEIAGPYRIYLAGLISRDVQ